MLRLRRLSILVAFLLVTATFLVAQERTKLRPSEIYGFHGRIHTQLNTVKTLNSDPRTGKRELFVREPYGWLEFDQSGQIIADGSVDQSGKPISIARRQHNAQGDELESTITAPDKTTHIRVERKAAANGHSETTTFVDGKLSTRTVETVNPEKNAGEITSYNDKGEVAYHSIFHNTDLRRESLSWDAGGKLVVHMERRFDDKGNLIGSMRYDATGKIASDLEFKDGALTSWWQDPECDCTNVAAFALGNSSVLYQTTRDGNLHKLVSHHPGRRNNIEIDDQELYDQNDHLLERVAYTYERDPQGNWTRRITSVLDSKTGIMVPLREDTRTLTYY